MIRKAKETDIDEIMDIWLNSNIDAHSFVPKEYWVENFNCVKKSILTAEVYIYTDDYTDDLIGFIGLADNYIAGLFVKQAARSKGVGKALLDYVKGIKSELFLDVYDKNRHAIRFYKREHFKVQEQNVDIDTKEKECRLVWHNKYDN